MSFELIAGPVFYSDAMNHFGGEGNCLGMSGQWAMTVIGSEAKNLAEPNVIEAKGLQTHYRHSLAHSNVSGAEVFFLEREAEKRSLGHIKRKTAIGYGAAVDLVNSLPKKSGNVTIVTCWDFSSEEHMKVKQGCLGRFRTPDSWAGHAVALFKSKKSGAIVFYDPNFGRYLWKPTAGMSLKSDIKRYLIDTYADVAGTRMTSAIMFSRDDHVLADTVPLDFTTVKY